MTSMPRALIVVVLAMSVAVAARAVPVSIVGTNDLHGRVERVAALAGHVDVLRARAKQAGGAVVLVDAGDLFQGTLESNLKEGAAVIAAYNHVGYDAVCIGNHEFDFGPVGDAVTTQGLADDPRGALKARAAEARFPFLAANTLEETTGAAVAWKNVQPAALLHVGEGPTKVPLGVVGVTTIETPQTTIASNLQGLRFVELAERVAHHASELRRSGARVVVVLAHAGGRCAEHSDTHDLTSCDADAEVMKLAAALPVGAVDVIVAGHTHQTMAHVVNGIAIIESWANGRGFGRIDLDVDLSGKAATKLVQVHPPRRLCGDGSAADVDGIEACRPAPYEGTVPVIDRGVLAAVAPFLADAKARRSVSLGVVVEAEIPRGYDRESPLGNLFTDLMLEAVPEASVAVMNGGGIRANLPAGPLVYGSVFEMMPFDNRIATVTMTVSELQALLARNLAVAKKGGLLSIAGVQVTIRCDAEGRADVVLSDRQARPLAQETPLRVVTTDFVAVGGDGGLGVDRRRITIDEGEPLREHLARALRRRGGRLRPTDPAIAPPTPRMHRPGATSARCGGG
jgi:2',3'-cyclic-nucleotide 2'-phosphodiesterase (5'-nucleotidase family)